MALSMKKCQTRIERIYYEECLFITGYKHQFLVNFETFDILILI